MNLLVINLRVAGTLLIALALLHVPIAIRFRWREESARLSPFNRQVLLVHAFFIALTVGLMGLLAAFWPEALTAKNPLGPPVAGGLTLFWGVRLYCQWFVYDRNLWRGKTFESAVHLIFTLFWIYLTTIFTCCWRLQMIASTR